MVRAKAAEEGRIAKQAKTTHSSRPLFDRLQPSRHDKTLSNVAARFADRLIVMECSPSGRRRLPACLRHAWRPSPRGTRRLRAVNCFLSGVGLGHSKAAGRKLRNTSASAAGCRIRNLFRRDSALRFRKYDELYSCSGAGTFNWIPYSRRSSLKIGQLERQAISLSMNYAEFTSSILKCLTAPT